MTKNKHDKEYIQEDLENYAEAIRDVLDNAIKRGFMTMDVIELSSIADAINKAADEVANLE